MPTTVTVTPLTMSVCPIAVSLAPIMRFQNPSLTTATDAALSICASSAASTRPRAAGTPSVWK